jgi:hypothetical protein
MTGLERTNTWGISDLSIVCSRYFDGYQLGATPAYRQTHFVDGTEGTADSATETACPAGRGFTGFAQVRYGVAIDALLARCSTMRLDCRGLRSSCAPLP